MPEEIKPYILIKEVQYVDAGTIKTRHSIIVKDLNKVINWLQSTRFKVKKDIDILSFPGAIEVE